MYVCTLSVAYLCNKISVFFLCVCVEPSSESQVYLHSVNIGTNSFSD